MNVLLYVMDALRADHVSCYGYDRETTPVVDGLAAEGVRYERAFSTATWTKPVGASLLTGLYPPVHGARTREDTFRRAVPRLPETLADAGYATGGFSTMGNVSASLGYDAGFDVYEDLYKDPVVVARRTTVDPDAEELDHEGVDEVALPRAEDVNGPVLEWVDSLADEDPFFAFCWSVEPHVPYDPPEGYREWVDPGYDGPVDGERESLPAAEGGADLQHLVDLYDGEVRYNDAQLGALLDGLRERDRLEETLVVVLGDHGDAFREHGQLTHGNLPYDEVWRVPLVVRPPGGTDDSTAVEEMTSLVDVAPTVLRACGADAPDDVQGRPLPPLGPAGSSAPVFAETRSRDVYPAYYGVRTEHRKYMTVEAPDRTPRTLAATAKQLFDQGMLWEVLRHPRYYLDRYLHGEDTVLFDLAADPEEHENLASERPEEAAEFAERLADWRGRSERLGATFEDRGGRIDEETSEQLRRLGYVD